MDKQKESTTPDANIKSGAQPSQPQRPKPLKEDQDEETRDEYSRQKDSEALPPAESQNLVRNNNLYQHKQAPTSEAGTEAAPQHAQPQQQMAKKGTIVYQQKLTTITYTKPEKEVQQAQPKAITRQNV